MVGLYKDPKGEAISTLGTTGLRDDAVSDNRRSSDTELKMLRRRVVELENSLKKHVSFSVTFSSCIHPFANLQTSTTQTHVTADGINKSVLENGEQNETENVL